jgi:hypothetical protein
VEQKYGVALNIGIGIIIYPLQVCFRRPLNWANLVGRFVFLVAQMLTSASVYGIWAVVLYCDIITMNAKDPHLSAMPVPVDH